MKKIYLILILLAGCQFLLQEEVTIDFDTNIIPTTRPLGGRVAVDIPGFDMKYDTVQLVVNNNATGFYFEEEAVGDIVRSIRIFPGTYDFYMDSDGDLIFNAHLKFTALLDSVTVTENVNLILPTETGQALLLIDKTGITGQPIINHLPTDDGSVYGLDVPMVEDEIYWYLFLYGDWSYKFDFIFEGEPGDITKRFEPGKVYIYNINGIGLGITDPFTEIIFNN